MQKRYAGLNSAQMRYSTEIHDLLRVGSSEQRKTRLAASHNVGVVAEYRESMAGNGSCGYMQNAR